MNEIHTEPARLLRDKQVAALLSISRSHLWRLVKQQRIPAPVKIGPKMTVWKSAVINDIAENPEKYLRIGA